MELRPLAAIDPDFLASFAHDPEFSDPMLTSEDQRRRNLRAALEHPEHHAVLGTFRGGKQTGLFVFLALREEKYLELLAGLSRDSEAYEAVLSHLAKAYPGWSADFVFNPRNHLLASALRQRNAGFYPEQQKMVFSGAFSPVSTDGIFPFSQEHAAAYFAIHEKDAYWTGEKVAAAPNQFRILLALSGGKVIGYLDVTHGLPENEPYDLFVLEAYRRKGYGRKLLAAALEANGSAGMSLLVDKENLPARNLYASMGFQRMEGADSLTVHWQIPAGESFFPE